VHCANSYLLVLYIHEEKSPPDFSSNPTLELLFAKNARANRSKNASSLAYIEHQTTTKKSLHIRPAMATLILAQHNNQPTISRYESKYEDNSYSSLCNFISVDCCIVASFLDLVKNTMAMLAMEIVISRRYYKQSN
jgi:hypothetical protein